MFDFLKKLLGLSGGKKKDTKKASKEEKEFLKSLPPGTVIKKVSISGEGILKAIFYIGILVFLLSFWNGGVRSQIDEVSYSDLMSQIKNQKVEEVVITDSQIIAKMVDEKARLQVANKEAGLSFTEYLQREGVDISKVKIRADNTNLGKTLESLVMVGGTIFMVAFFVWMVRRGSGGMGGGPFGFGKSNAKLFVKGKQKITFTDVAGVDEAKKDLVEVVDFLKNPTKYLKVGARVPKGVLLVGPAGVGKTLLAKAVAGEANVSFFSMAGSEFMEMLVGVGASRVRDLFATAKKAGKAIIFIDEIDAIGRMRGGVEGGHGEREQTLNQILVEMDGFEPNTSVVVLAATNRGDLLDPALKRPGRFDRTVVLEYPDLEARGAILEIHKKGKPFVEGIKWEQIAKKTVGFSGADLENMLNEAAISAARDNREVITKADLDEASLKVRIGPAKKRSQTDEDKLITAYHEAGHAIVNFVTKLDPVQKITIVSRGHALGFTFVPPERDRVHETKTRLESKMAMAMGGRAAEAMIFGEITTGASSDIQHATSIARNMVMEWGMSPLGPVYYEASYDESDFGRAYMEPSRISDGMRAKVDVEIQKLVDAAYAKAVAVLKKNKGKLDALSKLLVEKETIDEEEFEGLMGK